MIKAGIYFIAAIAAGYLFWQVVLFVTKAISYALMFNVGG